MNTESLLCDELWLSDPASTADCYSDRKPKQCNILESCECECDGTSFYKTKEECEEAAIICLDKELSYMPEPGYVEYLDKSNNLPHFRFRAIQWLIKEWKYWMVELVSVACLSIASKFNDTSSPSLHEIQMEELDYSFQSSTIRRMELTLLQSLGWRLGCITTYSYVELLLTNFDSFEFHLHNELTTLVTKLLLGAVLDARLLKYQPSVVAVSALWCSLDELTASSCAHVAFITRLFNQEQKDDVVKCNMIMKSRLVDPLSNLIGCGQPYSNWPSSPVTVLLRERIDIYDCQVDLSIFNQMQMQMPGSNVTNNLESFKKRRKE
ncbi:putative cyclin-D7-1 [Citrus sinensis]|nr:putative cyclin-D7-1 [Citrus sinensis]